MLAQKGIIPPREWIHSYDIKDGYNRTLKDYLEDNYLPIPKHWNNDDMTIFDKACFGIIPDIERH